MLIVELQGRTVYWLAECNDVCDLLADKPNNVVNEHVYWHKMQLHDRDKNKQIQTWRQQLQNIYIVENYKPKSSLAAHIVAYRNLYKSSETQLAQTVEQFTWIHGAE